MLKTDVLTRNFQNVVAIFIAALALCFLASKDVNAQTEPTTANELQSQGKSALTQNELSNLIVGNTLMHQKLKSTITLEMWYRADEERVYWTGGPGIGRRFQGWYKIKDGQRCELSGGGSEVCFRLFPSQDDSYFLCDHNDRCDWILTVESGNPLEIE